MAVSRVRRGLSLTEVLLAAMVIGVSALPVLELMRSSTVSLEINHIDAVARGLAADVLERIAGPSNFRDAGLDDIIENLHGTPAAWDLVLPADPSLMRGFPKAELSRLLDQYQVKLNVRVHRPGDHGAEHDLSGMKCVEVQVKWVDRNERSKEVTYARLVEE